MKKRYYWENWFLLPQFTLISGIHYDCSQSTMAQTVRNHASVRGLRVKLVDTGTAIVVRVIERRKPTDALPHTDKAPVAG